MDGSVNVTDCPTLAGLGDSVSAARMTVLGSLETSLAMSLSTALLGTISLLISLVVVHGMVVFGGVKLPGAPPVAVLGSMSHAPLAPEAPRALIPAPSVPGPAATTMSGIMALPGLSVSLIGARNSVPPPVVLA